MDMAVFLNQKRANVCEHMKKMTSLKFSNGATRGLREEWMEGNLMLVTSIENDAHGIEKLPLKTQVS